MHVIVAQRTGQDALILNNKEATEAMLRELCSGMVEKGMDKVVLHALNDASVLVPLQTWRKTANGVRKTKPDTRESSHVTADERSQDVQDEDESTPGVDAQIRAAAEADAAEQDAHKINGYCLVEKIHVDFVPTEIVEQANGTKRAKGICPSCGRGMNKIMSRAQVDEWGEDAPDQEAAEMGGDTEPTERAKADADDAEQADADLTEMVEDAVAQVAVGEDAEAVAAAATVVAVEFSEAAAEAAKVPPKTRASRSKAKATATDKDAEKTEKVKMGTCPQCQTRVPIVEKRTIDVYSKHNRPNADEQCAGSFTVAA